MFAGALVAVAARGAAAVSISGTVKVTGSASAADVVVYIQQAPGTFPPPAKPVEMDRSRCSSSARAAGRRRDDGGVSQ
jgi:hypothetical protein